MEREIPYRSPALALTLSLGSTATLLGAGLALQYCGGDVKGIGTGLLITGAVAGPAVGHMYTGHWGRAALFSAGRAGFLTVGVVGAALSLGAAFDEDGSGGGGGAALTWLGLLGWGGLTLWEVIDSWSAAEEFNAEQRELAFSVAPMVLPEVPGAADSTGMGLSFSARF